MTASKDCIVEFGERLWADDSGQDMVEYALLLVLLALAAVAAMALLGTGVNGAFQEASTQMQQTTS